MASKTGPGNDKPQAAHDKLQEAVAEVVSGEDWQRMLKIASEFHNYSGGGFQPLEVTRSVRQEGGEGLAIFAPCTYKTTEEDDDGNDKSFQQIRGFRIVHVFDTLSETEGDELPDLDAVRPKLLDADAPEGIWDALVAKATAAGFEVIRDRRGSENGYCDFSSKQISVRPDVAPGQAVKH